MREVVHPERVRELRRAAAMFALTGRSTDEEVRARKAEELAQQMAASAALVASCFKGLDQHTLRTIRRDVALRLPERPMSREEAQIWLDETCAGVAFYMKTGKVYGL